MTKTLTVKQAIEELSGDDWDALFNNWIRDHLEGEDIEVDEDSHRTFRRAFYQAVRITLEKMAPITLTPTPDEDEEAA